MKSGYIGMDNLSANAGNLGNADAWINPNPFHLAGAPNHIFNQETSD